MQSTWWRAWMAGRRACCTLLLELSRDSGAPLYKQHLAAADRGSARPTFPPPQVWLNPCLSGAPARPRPRAGRTHCHRVVLSAGTTQQAAMAGEKAVIKAAQMFTKTGQASKVGGGPSRTSKEPAPWRGLAGCLGLGGRQAWRRRCLDPRGRGPHRPRALQAGLPIIWEALASV